MDSRRDSWDRGDDDDDKRMVCRYGAKCYQKNPTHLRKFKHPSKNRGKPESDSSSKKRKSPPAEDRSNEPQTKKPSVSSESDKETDTKNESKNVKNNSESRESDSKNETTKMDVDSESPKVDSASEQSKTEDQKDSKKDEKSEAKITDDQDKTSETNDKSETSKDSNETETSKDSNKTETSKDSNKTETSKDSDKTETSKDSDKTETSKDSDKTETTETIKKAEPLKDNAKNEAPENDNKTETPKVEKESPKAVVETPTKIEPPKPQSKTVTPKVVTDSHAEARALIQKIFLVGMPDDFYKFYDFCNELKPSDPSTAFKIADIKLVGPYDVLTGLITKNTPNPENLLAHWRYYYDPPEFQTILKGNDREGLHFGYWRDRPSSDPAFVATNSSNVSHKIKPVAENVFGAITSYLEERAKKANPFEKTGFFNLLGKLKAYAKKYNIPLEAQTPKMKQREKNVVARTIHGAGVVCPYNKKSQLGYRELSVTDNQLLKIVKRIDDAKNDSEREGPRAELGDVVRLATIAGDECDFGTCLELGHDLLSTGCSHVQNAALDVLSIAYNQLERQAFLRIVEIHMKDRKKGCNTSALNSTPKEKC